VPFDERDVVRHALVQRIVKAYERYNETIGAGRQLSLKLSEPAAEAAPVAETAPAAEAVPAEAAGGETAPRA